MDLSLFLTGKHIHMSHLNFPFSVKRETSSYFSTTNTLSGLKLFLTRLQKNQRAEDDSIR